MDKLKMHSINKVDENIQKIGKLFPNCLTEAKNEDGKVVNAIDFDMLRQELSSVIVEGNEERYQFTWPDKKKSVLLANAPISATLRPCREESVDFDSTENLYIEGDNLDVLKLLQETYLGKIKMIYIDPPYNTGNDFVYEDDFAESTEEYLGKSGQFDAEGNRLVQNTESNGRFHTDWLNMIYPRLKIAKDLLSDDGVIFISIDDNEIENAMKTCNEIFGRENRVETIVWKNKYGAGAFTVGFISAHEYILCYSKKPITNITCNFEGEEREKYNKKDEKFSTRGPYRTQPLMTNSLGDRPNLMYSIFYNGVEIKPKKQWVWSKERMDKAIANNDVEFALQKDGGYSVRSKSYLIDENGKTRRGKPVSVMNGPFTQDGTEEVRALFSGESVFDFTKPSKLIESLVSLEVNNNDDKEYIVLDFFSGSATTAHAVMQLNAEDGGHRKFIMVQLPEQTDEKSEAYKAGYRNICEIGKERIRRAGAKIKEESPLTTADLDTGFRVLKLDTSNMKEVYYTPSEYTMNMLGGLSDNIKQDRTPEDLLFQVMLDLGVLLSSKIEETEICGKRVFTVAPELDHYLIACFDDNVTEEVITEIAKKKPYYFVMRDSSMASDSVAANFEQIFATYSPDTVRKVL